MNDLSRVLIAGGKSKIGEEINFGIKLGKEDLDVTNKDSIKKALDKYKPDILLNLASIDIKKCNESPLLAFKVNVLGTYNLALECARRNIKLTIISSGTIFNGNENDIFTENSIPDPQNLYGQTKYLAELIASKTNPKTLIFRAGWLFGFEKKENFFNQLFHNLKNNNEVKVTADQYGSFTYVKDFLEEMKIILQREEQGIFHIANSERASAFEFAEYIKKKIGSQSKIIITSIKESEKQGIKRSKSEVLISNKINLRTWREALGDIILK